MGGFNTLTGAMEEGAYNTLEVADVPDETGKLSDEAALKIVIQDVDISMRYVMSKALHVEWNTCDDKYRDYVEQKNWPGTRMARSTMPMMVIQEAVEALMHQAYMALFSDPAGFVLDPKGKTTDDAVRAMKHLVCWSIEMSGFKEEVRKMLKSAFLYGNLVAKLGYTTKKHKKKKYSRVGKKIGREKKEITISHPTLENVPLRNFLIESHTASPNPRCSPFRCFQTFITMDDLDALAQNDLYKNVPSREQMIVAMMTMSEPTKNSLQPLQFLTWREDQAQFPTEPGSIDPSKQLLELLEYHTDDSVYTVLQRCFVIRNSPNDIPEGGFLGCGFVDPPNSFYCFGVGKLLANEQDLQQGVINKWVDSLSLKLDPMWQRKKGSGAMSQSLLSFPGRIVNDDGELIMLEMEDVSEVALTAIGSSEQRAARRVGSNFGPEMPTQAMRTAEGVQAFQSGVQVGLQYWLEWFGDQVFIPAIKGFIELIKENMEPDEIDAILTEREGQAFQGDVLDVYNGQYDVDVLPSVKVSGRRAMAQLIIPTMQMMGQPAVGDSFTQQRKKFNWVNFFSQIFQIAGWPEDDLIQDMTPDDQQWVMQHNAAMVAAQAKQQQMQTQQNNALQLQDKKGEDQADLAIVKHALKQHDNVNQAQLSAPPLAAQPPQGAPAGGAPAPTGE